MIKNFIYLNGKTPLKGECLSNPAYKGHDEPLKNADYGGIYDGDYVKVDADDFETFKKLLELCNEYQLQYNAVKTSRGGHVYFKNAGLSKNRKQQKAVCGLKVEWKFAKSNDFVPIKRNGKILEWVRGSPFNKDIDVLPKWLYPEQETAVRISEGSRNDTLFELGSSLRGKGSKYEEILIALSVANIEKCIPPLREYEVKQTAEQVSKYPIGNVKQITTLNVQSARDLQTENLPPLRWFVDEIIPQGLTMLASPPKYGKSWLVLDLCLTITSGGYFLKRKTSQCGCLYLALEDSKHRLKNRINRLTLGKPAPESFYYNITASTLNNGLIEQLERVIEQHPEIALVIIDTLQKVRDVGGAKETGYATDYREVGAIKSFADRHNISVILVHHLRKMRDDDPFNQISGTQGVIGAADTAITLTKEKRNSDTATLSITGRDVTETQYNLKFDKNNTKWELIGSVEEIEEKRLAEEYEDDPIVRTVKHLLSENSNNWTGSIAELVDACEEFTGELPCDINDKNKAGLSKVGHKIKSIAKMLKLRDNITYEYIRLMDKRVHNFSKKKCDRIV
jgi:hypothetical protein